MELTIPVFNQAIARPGEKVPVYRACALFYPGIHSEDNNLRRAHARLLTRLRKQLNPPGRSWNHEELARMSFNPDIESKRLKLTLDLKTRRAKATIFFVSFEVLDRYAAFSPMLPSLWFDLDNPSDLDWRATAVFERYFRSIEKDPEDSRRPEDYASTGEVWISWADVNVRTDPITHEEMQRNQLALFSGKKMDGASELTTVGRCLDRLYPDDLQRALMREAEVETLDRLLQHPSRRPVLVVGPHLVGKTTLIHEVVYRRVDRREKKNSTKRNVWFLSPQRLISGMSFVGQWEDRLLAILGEANKRDHVLYFDDLISMFRAGQSRESNLCVADLVKNAIQDGEVRVVAEMTREAFHVLETRDRGFADHFHIIRLQPTSTDETREIGIRMIQELEKKYRCWFDWHVVEEATRIQDRYMTSAAMPGKLVKYLGELAAQWKNNRIANFDVNRLFRTKTGLSGMVLGNESLEFIEIRSLIKKQIIGQKRAVEVCGNVVSVARAGLNENDRPLATLLFLGPTGVGKTECAKTLADVMFAGQKHLIRFDLNQFKTAWSATTLLGTPDQPEGLLTSAVRQRPFSVVLLDEIEKAHPAVFDILLQVLGEGRLTDALGRTTDFSNCVIVMTSNLGTRRNQQGVGFVTQDDDQRFVKAARDFFRPEFFNRIDEIVPFSTLNRQEVRQIARKLVGDIVSREGLTRRCCILQIDKQAIDHVVDLGYHPELGARAMKRALEDQFTRRVSRTLAASPVNQPTIVRVTFEENQLNVETEIIDEAPLARPPGFSLEPDEAIRRVQKLLQRMERDHLAHRPQGEISSDGISPELLRYFSLDEQRNKVESAIHILQEAKRDKKTVDAPAVVTQARNRTILNRRSVDNLGIRVMKEIMAARDIGAYLDEVQTATTVKPLTAKVEEMIDQAAVLDAMVRDNESHSNLLFFRNLQAGKQSTGGSSYIIGVRGYIRALLEEEFDLHTSIAESDLRTDGCLWISVDGPCSSALVDQVTGSYMHVDSEGAFSICQVGKAPQALVQKHGIEEALNRLLESTDLDQEQNEALRIEPVRRLFVARGVRIDFPSGISTRAKMDSPIVRDMTLKSFPLPVDILEEESLATPNTPEVVKEQTDG